MTMRQLWLLGVLLWGLSYNVVAQSKQIELEDFYKRSTFGQKSVYGVRSMKDGLYYTALSGDRSSIVKYSYKTGNAVDTLLNLKTLKDSPIKNIQGYEFNANETWILLYTNSKPIYRHSFTADYYTYEIRNFDLKPLSTGGPQQLATFSPNGIKVSFVRDNNLFIHDVRFKSEVQITFDGKFNHILNGAPDWVYEEEFGFSRAYEWAPDGSAIAFIRFDESHVRMFHMNMFKGTVPAMEGNALYPSNYSYKYPKAGEENAKVSVHVYDIDDRTTLEMECGKLENHYIPRIQFSQDPKFLAIANLNRHQNDLNVYLANVKTGKSTLLYREKNDRYIDYANLDNLHFLEDGKHFVITSEKSGYLHLYLYNMGGELVRPITKGDFDLTSYYGYDAKTGTYYYASHEESPLEVDVFSINSKGQKKKLTPKRGVNRVDFSKNFNYYINYVSNVDEPLEVVLYDKKGRVVRTLEDNKELKATLAQYDIPKKEFIKLPAADGKTMLNAQVIKPTNFDPNKKYPVLVTQYSGPNSQSVKDSWGVSWLDYLAQEGYIVLTVDPRGTAARGEEFRKCTYMQLGKLESDDMIAATRSFADNSYVDNQNIGIWGWSYGGFMSSLCLMKGNDVFSTAIAVAPVTNWRYYDSIYTERYMRTPQENPSGYDDNSPSAWVNELEGNLLLVHGTADDNVHVQNVYELSEYLVQADKAFDMAIYTNRNHSIFGGNTRLHLYKKFVKYLNDNLK